MFFLHFRFLLKIEVLLCIVIAYILNDFAGPFHIIWQFAILYFFAKQVAQYPAEIFMSRKRQKAARISEHANKATN